ncbi:hypothetical protein H0H93_010866, partial [Arthromyces matolae]
MKIPFIALALLAIPSLVAGAIANGNQGGGKSLSKLGGNAKSTGGGGQQQQGSSNSKPSIVTDVAKDCAPSLTGHLSNNKSPIRRGFHGASVLSLLRPFRRDLFELGGDNHGYHAYHGYRNDRDRKYRSGYRSSNHRFSHGHGYEKHGHGHMHRRELSRRQGAGVAADGKNAAPYNLSTPADSKMPARREETLPDSTDTSDVVSYGKRQTADEVIDTSDLWFRKRQAAAEANAKDAKGDPPYKATTPVDQVSKSKSIPRRSHHPTWPEFVKRQGANVAAD